MRIAFFSIVPLLILFLLPPAAERRHRDVDNIGNRDITTRSSRILPNFVSLEKEVELGARLAHEFERNMRLLEDLLVTEYIDRLGRHIVEHSDARIPVVIKVTDSNEVNAQALPGGYLYVHKGLIIEADTEAELAGVVAHEVAHLAARHATERLSTGQLLALPALLLGGYWSRYGIQKGLDLALLKIARKAEMEADQLGTQYVWNAGYDPRGFVAFLEKYRTWQIERPGKFASLWRTHPPVEERIHKLREEISRLPRRNYRITSSTFRQVKARLATLSNISIIDDP